MSDKKFNWTRQPQEVEGQDYWFGGKCFVTAGVQSEIPRDEILAIVADIQEFAEKSTGVDYLQSFVNEETGRKIWAIDQVTKASLSSGNHPPEHNYFTVLFPSEY